MGTLVRPKPCGWRQGDARSRLSHEGRFCRVPSASSALLAGLGIDCVRQDRCESADALVPASLFRLLKAVENERRALLFDEVTV